MGKTKASVDLVVRRLAIGRLKGGGLVAVGEAVGRRDRLLLFPPESRLETRFCRSPRPPPPFLPTTITTSQLLFCSSIQVFLSRVCTSQLAANFRISKPQSHSGTHLAHSPIHPSLQVLAMAGTRSTTGSSKPRIFNTVSTEPTRKTTTKKKTTKANTSKPRAKTGAGVTKKKAPAKKPTVKAKVEGAAEKVVGKIEDKPGKKAAGTKKMKGETTAKKPAKKVVVKK